MKVPATVVFQSLFYWMYIKNPDRANLYLHSFLVSILVLLDVHKEQNNLSCFRHNIFRFQSLFYWMYIKNIDYFPIDVQFDEFQSLFYWMYIKNPEKIIIFFTLIKVSILVLLDVHKEPINFVTFFTLCISFNPCFIGCT